MRTLRTLFLLALCASLTGCYYYPAGPEYGYAPPSGPGYGYGPPPGPGYGYAYGPPSISLGFGFFGCCGWGGHHHHWGGY